jgi:uncharacterized protein (DUF1330 family)
MPAYFIAVRKTLKDPEAFVTYGPLARPTVEAANGKILAARGEMKTVEGDAINSATVIEFPSYAEAVAWYESPAYQEAIPHRMRGGDYQSFIIDGTVPPQV